MSRNNLTSNLRQAYNSGYSKKNMRKNVFKNLIVAVLGLVLVLSPLAVGATYSNEGTTTNNVDSISLSGSGEKISWSVNGYSGKGFKVVWSKNSGPTYPLRSGDKYHYYTDPNKTGDALTAFNGGGTYYVRVCEYLGGKCGVYSNEIQVALGTGEVKPEPVVYNSGVKSISLKSEGEYIVGRDAEITWSVNGYSEKGYKVVWSKNSNPTYPLRMGDKYHYYSDPNKLSDTLTAFDGDGTYYVRVCEYLGGKCGVYSNEIKVSLEKKEVFCTMDWSPVCGKDGRTYSNKCMASKNGIAIAYDGECPKDEAVVKIEEKATLLMEDKMDQILAELRQLRDLVKEQEAEIRYLKGLVTDLSGVTTEMQNRINQFITYGVDANTERLGAGERAAVMYSYKQAYGELPGDEQEMTDAVKIANGRWPGRTNEAAENKAEEHFRFIYQRDPEMSNASDVTAIKIMAYGLRQRADNRNLDSEKRGIAIFKGIYGHTPQNTEEWNIMQAITYSGAQR